MDTTARVERREWIALAVILVVYVALIWIRTPYQRFGRYHDDTLYASAARAIADGRGHIQPNLPGAPPATKYPPGYAYALAAVMAAFPAAYDDPAILWALSAVAGAVSLAFAFLQLRSWKEISWIWAAAAVAVCAVQPTFLVNSGAVLSDVPFMALALAAFYLLDLERRGSGILLAAGAFAGLAILTRTVGVAVFAGALAALATRRGVRKTIAFCLGALPFGLMALAARLPAATLPPDAAAGFRQTWLYYTDYAGFWQASVPSLETLRAMLYSNLGMLAWAPAELCLGTAPDTKAGKIAWALASAAIVSGVARQARADRWRAIHFGLLFTAPAVLLWNYEIGARLLLPFAPLFALGLFVEARRLASNIAAALKGGNATGDRVVAAAALAILGVFAAFVANRTLESHLVMVAGGRLKSHDEEYRELYSWLREHTRPEERFVAIDDALFYLRTGRQGMWPLALTTEPRFNPDPARFAAQMDLLPEVARETGARYAIQADHDYAYAPAMQQRWKEWTAGLPTLVENSSGTARILDLEGRMAQR